MRDRPGQPHKYHKIMSQLNNQNTFLSIDIYDDFGLRTCMCNCWPFPSSAASRKSYVSPQKKERRAIGGDLLWNDDDSTFPYIEDRSSCSFDSANTSATFEYDSTDAPTVLISKTPSLSERSSSSLTVTSTARDDTIKRKRPTCSCSLTNQQWVKPEHIVTSYFIQSPVAIMLIRWVILAYMIDVLYHSILTDIEGGYYFVYFTHLSYIGLTVYFLNVSMLSLRYNLQRLWRWFHGTPTGDLLKRPANMFETLASWMYTSSFPIHIIVNVIFWVFLAPHRAWELRSDYEQWLTVSEHGTDLLVLIIEFFLNRAIFMWSHLIITLFIFVLYALFTFVVAQFAAGQHGIEGYPYPFMDLDSWANVGVMGLIGGAVAGSWVCLFFLHRFKAWLGHKLTVSEQ